MMYTYVYIDDQRDELCRFSHIGSSYIRYVHEIFPQLLRYHLKFCTRPFFSQEAPHLSGHYIIYIATILFSCFFFNSLTLPYFQHCIPFEKGSIFHKKLH